MKRKRVYLKKKIMPVTTMDTKDLLTQIQAGFLTQPQSDALNELFAREIKTGDPDEIKLGGLDTTKGAIRPKTQPLVP